MKIEDLIKEGETVLSTQRCTKISSFVNNGLYEPWKRKTLMFLQEQYPLHPQTKSFEKIVDEHNHLTSNCESLLAIVKAFAEVSPQKRHDTDYDCTLSNIFNRFSIIARQLKRRYSDRKTLIINDEYDVQDLLHALLVEHFDDVRPEEWTPSYAGGSNRIDFLLKDEEIAIEVKMTRCGLRDKEIGDQLLIDIAKYEEHPNCKQLYCFVYDPQGLTNNPRGLEKDLAKKSDRIGVHIFIRPI